MEEIKELKKKVEKLNRDRGCLRFDNEKLSNKLKVQRGAMSRVNKITLKDKVLFVFGKGKLSRALNVIKLLGGN